MRRFLSPTVIVGIILALYLGSVLFNANGDPLAFARIGGGFANGIPVDPEKEGYDGQFAYFIALDPNPATVKDKIDVPAYRYQRILYPLLARLLAFGQPMLIPWMLVLINLVAHLLNVFLLERILLTFRVSRWYALAYGLWAGLLMSVRLDLNEPLCFALITGALLAHLRSKPWLTWLLFALALFAKETAILFVVAYGLYQLTTNEGRRATDKPSRFPLSTFHLLPFALFQFWLYQSFGVIGLSSGGYGATPFEPIPFMGLWHIAEKSWRALLFFLVIIGPFILFPALWAGWVAVQRMWKREFDLSVWMLAAHSVVIIFAPFSTMREPLGMLRLAIGLVLAIMFYAAQIRSVRVLNYSLFWIATLVFLRE